MGERSVIRGRGGAPRLAERLQQRLDLDGLGQEPDRTQVQPQLHPLVHGVARGQHDRQPGPERQGLLQHADAVLVREAHVEQDHVDRGLRVREVVERALPRRAERGDLLAVRGEHALQGARHLGLVLDDQHGDPGRSSGRRRRPGPRLRAGRQGGQLDPEPGPFPGRGLDGDLAPVVDDRPHTAASPSPVPWSALVEKNGSKIRPRTSSAIPTPVSQTSSATCSAEGHQVRTVRVPPSGMASRALIARFRIALCSWLGSPRTHDRGAPSS